eukprot:Platyproteum_vivax@DN1017_c0_g1_i1.p1
MMEQKIDNLILLQENRVSRELGQMEAEHKMLQEMNALQYPPPPLILEKSDQEYCDKENEPEVSLEKLCLDDRMDDVSWAEFDCELARLSYETSENASDSCFSINKKYSDTEIQLIKDTMKQINLKPPKTVDERSLMRLLKACP